MKVKMGVALYEKTNALKGGIASLMRDPDKAERGPELGEGTPEQQLGCSWRKHMGVRPWAIVAHEHNSTPPNDAGRITPCNRSMCSVPTMTQGKCTLNMMGVWSQASRTKWLPDCSSLNLDRKDEHCQGSRRAMGSEEIRSTPSQGSAGRTRERARFTVVFIKVHAQELKFLQKLQECCPDPTLGWPLLSGKCTMCISFNPSPDV